MLARRLLRTVAFFSQNQNIEGPRKYGETFSRARNVMDLYNLEVYSEGNIFIAPNATIVGEVFLGHEIAIWHGTVIRGDINRITLVRNISIGNNCVLHTAPTSPSGLGAELRLEGDNVIQNNCTLYSCVLEYGAYIGHNSVIMEGAIIQKGAIVAPNSVVPPGRVVKERQVWGGNPIKYVRKAMEQEGFVTLDYARHVNLLAQEYRDTFLPYNNAYLYRHGPSEPLSRHVSTSNWQQTDSDNFYDPTDPTGNRYL